MSQKSKIKSQKSKNIIYQQGQILLIVILIMVVGLTIGLSLASRNVINLKLATEEENSKKALSAAEAGIEQALINKDATGQFLGTAKISKVTTKILSGTTFLLQNGMPVNKDNGIDVWVTQYNQDPAQLYQNPWSGTLTFYWGSTQDSCQANPTNNTMAALEIIVISGSKTAPQITRYGFDPCTVGRRTSNKFTPANTTGMTIQGIPLAFATTTLSITNGLTIRVIPLYANAIIGVKSSSTLPTQGQLISSTGVAGSIQRKVTYFQANDFLPPEFFYTIFSPK